MKKKLTPAVKIFLIMLIVGLLGLLGKRVHQVNAYDCCNPPLLASAAARFPQAAQVTVYLDTTGLTTTEVNAIVAGLQDWNGQPNHSGVTYNVVQTTNPPQPGTNNTIVAHFVNQTSTGTGGAALNMHSSGSTVYGELTFWNNIRSGTPSLLPGLLRTTATHEGGHGLIRSPLTQVAEALVLATTVTREGMVFHRIIALMMEVARVGTSTLAAVVNQSR